MAMSKGQMQMLGLIGLLGAPALYSAFTGKNKQQGYKWDKGRQDTWDAWGGGVPPWQRQETGGGEFNLPILSGLLGGIQNLFGGGKGEEPVEPGAASSGIDNLISQDIVDKPPYPYGAKNQQQYEDHLSGLLGLNLGGGGADTNNNLTVPNSASSDIIDALDAEQSQVDNQLYPDMNASSLGTAILGNTTSMPAGTSPVIVNPEVDLYPGNPYIKGNW
jgi:hypothetical protein